DPLKEAANSAEGILASVTYQKHLVPILDNKVITDENIRILLSKKSCQWMHEDEWRLIVKLEKTVGTGNADEKGYPICLFEIPNTCVTEIYYTERTPFDAVKKIQNRIDGAENGYSAPSMKKLILSDRKYAYRVKAG
ncbi:MAG: hypothetical protein MI824_17285, partial [Hyphomicrobiales bacterium]|nr:hypothetical protein [Hyphomicrobiales bacterium]